jgi:hypothetical protein
MTFSTASDQSGAVTANRACTFSADAADLSRFFKLAEIFRKNTDYVRAIASDSIFIDQNGGSLRLTVFANHGSFTAILPGESYGSFCLPYSLLLRSIKGAKGSVTLKDGILTTAGASINCPIGQDVFHHPDAVIEAQASRPMLCPFWGFSGAPSLPWSALAAVLPAISDDAAKRVLNGAYSNGTYCYGTDGHRLRRSLAARPAWSGETASGWFPRHLLLMVGASTLQKESADQTVHSAQDGAYDFAQWTADNGRQHFSLRWARQENTYPDCDRLWPDASNHKYTLQVKRADMLTAVKAMQERLKASDGLNLVDLELYDGECKLSALIQKNTSTKKYCPEYFTIGQVEQTISATYTKHPDWHGESQREAYTHSEMADRRHGLIVLNVAYVREMLESMEGFYVTISTVTGIAPVTFSSDIPGDSGIVMPVQRRR